MFLDCPAYVGQRTDARCGLPAEVDYAYTMQSTDGPLECAKIRCPRGHVFNGPVEALRCDERPGPAREPHVPAVARLHADFT
jgi:hypothetical protein